MARHGWLRTPLSAKQVRTTNQSCRHSAAAGRRPRFEPLEERRLLAITVNTIVDELDGSLVDGDISLRDAIAAAPAGETINFASALDGQTITLSLGELALERSIKIDASALAGGLTLDASGNDLTPMVDKGDGTRVFRITDELPGAIAVELHGLTLTGGDVSGNGGAVLFRRAGSLTITGSTIAGNSATAGGGLWARTVNSGTVNVVASIITGNAAKTQAGGIYADAANSGSIVVRDSTISGNAAASDGGGVYMRTAAGASMELLQSTVSGNSANWRGGGVFAFSTANATAMIRYGTITANTADADANNPVIETGGGVFAGGMGTLKLESSIVAANADLGNHSPDVKVLGGVLAPRYNLIGANGGSGLAPAPVESPDANNNIVGGATPLDPGLDPLANNGGPTLTHALLTASPAVDRGSPSPLDPGGLFNLFDQRGASFGRIRADGAAPRMDIGAFELSTDPVNGLLVDTFVDEDDGNLAPGDVSLREAIRVATVLANEATITFAPALSGQDIILSMGTLSITAAMTIDASMLADDPIISAGSKFRIFDVTAPVTLKNLWIAGGGGNANNQGSGIRVQSTDLTLDECVLLSNSNGAIAATNSSLTILRSSIRGNTGLGLSGGIYLENGSLQLTDSEVSSNFQQSPGAFGVYAVKSMVTVESSTIDNNHGGGIRVDGTLVLNKSTVKENDGSGIEITAQGAATLSDSTISFNESKGAGGGINCLGSLTMTNSTVSNNTADTSGGGIRIGTGTAYVIRHSTITGNLARGLGGQFGAGGGGIGGDDGIVTLEHTIVSGNQDPNKNDLTVRGRLFYSILGSRSPSGPSLVNLGGSLLGTNSNPIDAKLGPLTDNGGPTQTHELLAGSVAVNAGDPTVVAGQNGAPPDDQRGVGYSRVVGGRIDIGAFEAGSGPNTDPVITTPSSVLVAENAAGFPVVASDNESPPQVITLSIVGGADADRFTLLPTHELLFNTPPDYEAPTDANGDNVYVVSVRADDGSGGFDVKEFTITVTPVNDNLPQFLSPGAVNVVEGSTLVLLVFATDEDLPAQSVTYSIAGGDDAARFTILPSGSLLFADAPDFEAPTDANGDNVYEVTVQASDGEGGATTQAISVTITSSVPPPPASADFNGDGFVTAADLAIWRQNFGTTAGPNPTPGDADGDRDVDGADFLIWQRTLGQVALPAAAASVASSPIDDGQAGGRVDSPPAFSLERDVLLAPPGSQRGHAVSRPSYRPSAATPMQRVQRSVHAELGAVVRTPPIGAAAVAGDGVDDDVAEARDAAFADREIGAGALGRFAEAI